MDRDELKSLLEPLDALDRQPSCPSDEQLASYMEGGLSERQHRKFETHLADCAWCMERIGILGRALEHEIEACVPNLALARALRMADDTQKPASRWRQAPAWAAAALVVLAVGLMVRNQLALAPEGDLPSPAVESRSTRSVNPQAMGPGLLAPGDGIHITLVNGTFDWTPVTDSLYYQVRIVSDEGDLLWQERVHGTAWVPPTALTLVNGDEYFVRVDAFLSESRSVNSDYVVFRAGERP